MHVRLSPTSALLNSWVGRGNALPTAYCWAPTREPALHLAFDMCDHIWASGRLSEVLLSPLLPVRKPSVMEITNGLHQDSNTFQHKRIPTHALFTQCPQLPMAQFENQGAQIPSPSPFPQVCANAGCKKQRAISFHLWRARNPFYSWEQLSLYDSPVRSMSGVYPASESSSRTAILLGSLWPWVNRPHSMCFLSLPGPCLRQHLRYNKAHGVCERKCLQCFRYPKEKPSQSF